MLQRLAVARALIGDPTLILADEPFTGLDRAASELLRRILVERRDDGAAVVLVTHDLADAAALADDVIVLRRGKVTHAGALTAGAGVPALEALYQAHAM